MKEMKGEEAKLLGLLREFRSVKMSCTSCLFFLFFCLRGFKLDKTHNYSGDISETEAITSDESVPKADSLSARAITVFQLIAALS